MYNLISIAILAFVGFAPLAATAPTHMGMNEVAALTMPSPAAVTWNSEQLQHDVFAHSNNYIEAAIAQALAEHRGAIMKRDNGGDEDALQLDLSSIFRGMFDNIVDYIIEVTPLNDIVHGNYDLLYDIFLTKVDEMFANMGAPDTAATAPLASDTAATAPLTPDTAATAPLASDTAATAPLASDTAATAPLASDTAATAPIAPVTDGISNSTISPKDGASTDVSSENTTAPTNISEDDDDSSDEGKHSHHWEEYEEGDNDDENNDDDEE